MTAYTKISPRVLTVENESDQLEAMELYLHSIPRDFKQPLGIDQFRIDQAVSINGALNCLNRAGEAGIPYDICMLDLSLPQNDGGKDEGPTKGFQVLEHVMRTRTAKKVIIVSVFDKYKYVIAAFRGGAVDFVAKPFNKESLQAQVLNCLQNLLTEESDRILSERVKELVPYAEKGLTHSFTAIFSALLNSITHSSAEIEKYAIGRYGLDPERYPQDALVRQLRMHRESVEEAKRKWAALLPGEDEAPQVKTVEDLLNDINEKLRPCLIVKRTQLHLNYPQSDWSPVLTFQRDVQAVLKEIIAGALSQLPDCGDEMEIKVTVEKNVTQAVVRFEDKLEKISREERNRINEGYSIILDPKLGRVWGLSVAQHIALRGGGELKIEEGKPRGNVITYYILLATDAKDTGG